MHLLICNALGRTALVALVVVAGFGCDDDVSFVPDAGVFDAAPLVQGGQARGDLVINEVAPRPVTGADWIELHNRSDAPIDLCGYFLTDSLDRLDHYTPLGGAPPPDACAPRWLEPGGYYLVHADDRPELGPEHARFKLGFADAVHVVTIDGLPMDSLVYLYPESADSSDLSLARAPDGLGPFYLLEPSPAAINPDV